MYNQITTWNLLKTKARKCKNPCPFSTFLVSMFRPTKYKDLCKTKHIEKNLKTPLKWKINKILDNVKGY